MSGLLKFPTERIEDIYLEVGERIFSKYPLMGIIDLFFKNSKFNSDILEHELRSYFGEDNKLSDFSKNKPMVSCTASESSLSPGRLCVFSTYDHEGLPFHGTNKIKTWEAVRASCSAPFYFTPMKIENISYGSLSVNPNTFPGPIEMPKKRRTYIDGAVISANPSYISYLESRFLFKSLLKPFVVNVGTGQALSSLPDSNDEMWIYGLTRKTIETSMSVLHVPAVMSGLLHKNYYYINGTVAYGGISNLEYVKNWIEEGKNTANSFSEWETLIKKLRS